MPETFAKLYEPAMAITDPDRATEYFDALVRRTRRMGQSLEEAESIQRFNLGYYAGYYSHDVQERVERLFGAVHPIFGSSLDPNNAITPEKAFEMGQQLGEAMKNGVSAEEALKLIKKVPRTRYQIMRGDV